jgi:hypothetical protein
MEEPMSDRPYSRVYHEIVEDPKFAEVYASNARLATWLRLLIAADSAYPAPSAIPRGTDHRVMTALVTADLVARVGSQHYRIKGLAAERSRRSERGKAGGIQRSTSAERDDAGRFRGQHAGGSLDSTLDQRPASTRRVQDETRRDEKEKVKKEKETTLDKARTNGPPTSTTWHIPSRKDGESYKEELADAMSRKFKVSR